LSYKIRFTIFNDSRVLNKILYSFDGFGKHPGVVPGLNIGFVLWFRKFQNEKGDDHLLSSPFIL